MKQLNFAIEDELHKKARLAAVNVGLPLKGWLTKLIDDATREPKAAGNMYVPVEGQ